jgi:hypothetical protein
MINRQSQIIDKFRITSVRHNDKQWGTFATGLYSSAVFQELEPGTGRLLLQQVFLGCRELDSISTICSNKVTKNYGKDIKFIIMIIKFSLHGLFIKSPFYANSLLFQYRNM